MTYKEKLETIKERLYLNNAQLAVKLDVNRAQITRWMDGNVPSYPNRKRIDRLYYEVCT